MKELYALMRDGEFVRDGRYGSKRIKVYGTEAIAGGAIKLMDRAWASRVTGGIRVVRFVAEEVQI